MAMTLAEAEREYLACEQEIARRRMLGFVQYTNRAYEVSWHHRQLAEHLDAVLAGTIRRLMVFMPPQHGKSEQVSRRFPAFALGKYPDWPIIATSYGSELATDMSREVQKVIDSREYRALFPGTRLATARDVGQVRMAAEFDVVGRQGGYYAAGVGAGITGRSMMLGIVDDPIKSREEAESEAYRKRVWNWYVSDFSTRMIGDQTRIVLVQTRWHEDDLAGRLLRAARENPLADQWTVLTLPAVATGLRDGDPRQIGDALWPTRFSTQWLEAKRLGSGVYDWSALYQQQPVPPGGAMAQRDWFKITPVRRAGVKRRCRCWDIAGTKPTPGRDPDWTVGTLIAEHHDKTWTVEHVVRVRTTAGSVDALIKQTAQADGRAVLVREFLDPGAAGKAVIASHLTLLPGYDYDKLPQTGEKSTRWRPFFVQAEGGNVYLLQAAWNRDWLDEMAMVPYGLHDDQADSAAGGFNALCDVKERGPDAGVIMPGTAPPPSGRPVEDWRSRYFRR